MIDICIIFTAWYIGMHQTINSSHFTWCWKTANS